jgi:two-component system, response regulator YesN
LVELLIIDGEKTCREEIRSIINESQYNYHSIYESDSGGHALSIFQQKRPSIVIMDVSLPDVEGIQFGKELLKLSPQVSIIVLTHLKTFEKVQCAINTGFRGYLLKPLSKVGLLSVLDRLRLLDLMKQSKDLSKEMGSADNLKIDIKSPIKHALNYIQHNYQDDITLHQVARIVYLSDSYFSRLFKAEMQVSFIEYLTKYRIEQAKKLLKMASFPIEVVANHVGFTNASYFTTTFKRLVGITPTDYRGRINKGI